MERAQQSRKRKRGRQPDIMDRIETAGKRKNKESWLFRLWLWARRKKKEYRK